MSLAPVGPLRLLRETVILLYVERAKTFLSVGVAMVVGFFVLVPPLHSVAATLEEDSLLSVSAGGAGTTGVRRSERRTTSPLVGGIFAYAACVVLFAYVLWFSQKRNELCTRHRWFVARRNGLLKNLVLNRHCDWAKALLIFFAAPVSILFVPLVAANQLVRLWKADFLRRNKEKVCRTLCNQGDRPDENYSCRVGAGAGGPRRG